VLLTKSEKAESNEAKRKEGRRCEDESESAQRRGKTLRGREARCEGSSNERKKHLH